MLHSPNICETETKWLAACAALALGEFIGFRCQGFSSAWPALLIATVLCTLFGYGLSIRGWRQASLAFLGATLALVTVSLRRTVVQEAHIHSSGKPYRAVFTLRDDATVKRMPKGDDLIEFQGEIRSLRIKIRAIVPPGTAPPKAGETWQCLGWLSGWNEWDILHRRELSVRGKHASLIRLYSGISIWARVQRLLHELRKDVMRRLCIGLENNERGANLLCAMLLGKRSIMDSQDRQMFVDAGAMHVFAISGLHVMVIARVLTLMGVVAMLPLRFTGILAAPLIWLYVLMAGSPPSAVRAAGMVTICLAAPLFWRRQDSIVAWAIAFIAAHILNPSQIMDAGSGLSFVVMLSLVFMIRLCGDATKRPIIGTLVFSSVAWAASLPISAHVFGRIALGGLLSGPIVIPAATCATLCGATGILTSFISPHLAAYPNACAGILMRFMAAVCGLIAKIPGANIELVPWSIGECLACYVAFSATFWLILSIRSRRSSSI